MIKKIAYKQKKVSIVNHNKDSEHEIEYLVEFILDVAQKIVRLDVFGQMLPYQLKENEQVLQFFKKERTVKLLSKAYKSI